MLNQSNLKNDVKEGGVYEDFKSIKVHGRWSRDNCDLFIACKTDSFGYNFPYHFEFSFSAAPIDEEGNLSADIFATVNGVEHKNVERLKLTFRDGSVKGIANALAWLAEQTRHLRD